MEVDYLLVGQGIAGTVLADHLLSAGQRVMVIDSPVHSNSSRVAGGLYNPITGRKMVKTWKADVLFPYLETYYAELQSRLCAPFFFPMPIYRPFVSVEEENEWMGKSADPAFAAYIEKIIPAGGLDHLVHDPFGGLLLKRSGRVDIAALIMNYRQQLLERSLLQEESFDFSMLRIELSRVQYKGIESKRIIFCDGKMLQGNPYFGWLPMHPVKGELLLIEPESPFEVILNRGVFVAPTAEGGYKVGSTYDHNDLSTVITEKGRNQLLEKLSALVKFGFEIVGQTAGVRPSTKDRRPFIGIHPEHPNIGVFNGFGTKGVSLVPLFANQYVSHLIEGTELDDEVNIERFFSLY